MFVTKRHLPRRTFLRGAGVTLALPLLESMLPAMTPLRLTAAAPVKRFVGIWHPHGAAPGYWSPCRKVATSTSPSSRNRWSRSAIVSCSSWTRHAGSHGHRRGTRRRSRSRRCAVVRRPPRRNAVSPYLGVTIDQLIANQCGRDTILSSMQLGVEDTGNFGNCNWGYSCAHQLDLVVLADAAASHAVNPRVVFERLFGDGTSPEERLAGRRQNASILDSVTRELTHFEILAPAIKPGSTPMWTTCAFERRIRIAMTGEGAQR